MLREYNSILPDAANRIIKMAEDEATHRRKMEQKALIDSIWEGRIGQFLAFLIGVFTIGCGTYTAINGAEIAGSLIGAGGVIGLVSTLKAGMESTGHDVTLVESPPDKEAIRQMIATLKYSLFPHPDIFSKEGISYLVISS